MDCCLVPNRFIFHSMLSTVIWIFRGQGHTLPRTEATVILSWGISRWLTTGNRVLSITVHTSECKVHLFVKIQGIGCSMAHDRCRSQVLALTRLPKDGCVMHGTDGLAPCLRLISGILAASCNGLSLFGKGVCIKSKIMHMHTLRAEHSFCIRCILIHEIVEWMKVTCKWGLSDAASSTVGATE